MNNESTSEKEQIIIKKLLEQNNTLKQQTAIGLNIKLVLKENYNVIDSKKSESKESEPINPTIWYTVGCTNSVGIAITSSSSSYLAHVYKVTSEKTLHDWINTYGRQKDEKIVLATVNTSTNITLERIIKLLVRFNLLDCVILVKSSSIGCNPMTGEIAEYLVNYDELFRDVQ